MTQHGNIQYLTPAQVARHLLVSPVTVRQWAQKGWLKAEITAGGHRRFLLDEVERFSRSRGLNLHQPMGEAPKILIVDDDPLIRDFLRELLIELPEHPIIAVAADGFEAGVQVQTFRPDIMLLDLKMPGMDGFAVCRRLKNDPATGRIRIIAMTGYNTPDNVSRILEAGAEACLGKPFDNSELLAALGLGQANSRTPAAGAAHPDL